MNIKHLSFLLLGVTSTLVFADAPIDVTATFSPAVAAQADWNPQMKASVLQSMRGALEPGKPTALEPLPSYEFRFPTAAVLDRDRLPQKELLWPTVFETRILGPAVNLTVTRQTDGRILFHGTCRITRPTGKEPDMSPTHHTVSLLTYDTLFFGVAKVGKPFVVNFDKSAAKDVTMTLTFVEPKEGS